MDIRKVILFRIIFLIIILSGCSKGNFNDNNEQINSSGNIDNFLGKSNNININNCDLMKFSTTSPNKLSNADIYIVGHAYGKPGEGEFFPNNLTSFFDLNINKNSENYIALNGDFVRTANNESFRKVKEYIEDNFDGYFISIGNHEVSSDLQSYFNYFDSDFFFQEFNNFLIISANFSNNNWLPSNDQIEKINKLIEDTDKKYIFLLSHQLFWINEAGNEIKPNSDDLLTVPLEQNSLNWLNPSNDKKFIVISGDYGAWGDKTYCKLINNKLFIANGIGDTTNDSIIKIHDYDNSFFIEEIILVNEN